MKIKKKTRPGKRGRKGIRNLSLLLACAAAAAGVYAVWQFRAAVKQTSATVRAAPGEEILFARLGAVRGNEITYFLAEQTENGTSQEGGFRGSAAGNAPERGAGETGTGRRGTPGNPGAVEGAGISAGDSAAAGQIQGPADTGAEAGDVRIPEAGGKTLEAADTFTCDGNTYRLTEQETAELIPVGTPVTTKLGTITTFSRLEAGDLLAIVKDKESGEITAIYIIG